MMMIDPPIPSRPPNSPAVKPIMPWINHSIS